MNRHELSNPSAFMSPAQILDGLTPDQAARHVAVGTHSIVEVLAHLVFWQSWLLDRCAGIARPPVAHAADGWPTAGPADWAALRERFVAGVHEAAKMTAEGQIQPPFEFPPMAQYTVDDTLAHLAMHNAHHLGQIVTIRQLIGQWPPPGGSYTW